MYLRTTPRKNKDGSVVRYLQLAHNTWDPVAKRSRAQVIYNFGREETANRAALTRLIASVTRFLEPDAALAAGAGEGLAFLEARPLGGTYVLDALWQRLEEGQPLAGAGGQGGVGLEKAGHRGDEARQRGPVGSVLSAEVVDHLGTGALGHRVPRVVGQLQVADYRAILVLPRSGSQVHRLDNLTDTPEAQHLLDRTCIYDIPGFCPGLRLLSRAYMPECRPEPRLAAEPRPAGHRNRVIGAPRPIRKARLPSRRGRARRAARCSGTMGPGHGRVGTAPGVVARRRPRSLPHESRNPRHRTCRREPGAPGMHRDGRWTCGRPYRYGSRHGREAPQGDRDRPAPARRAPRR